jgi:NDP-sugar pyrophosphorylase family protein
LQCVILAGGLATRMKPYTSAVPKCLLPVAGRPFADWQLTWLASEGVERVVYCIGHLGELVRDYVGDGSAWGINTSFVDEGDRLLGTAGALRLASDGNVLDESFFVVYGDSYLSVDLSSVEKAFRSSECPALMTVFRNAGFWEESNVVLEEGLVRRYQKHCPDDMPEMLYVDYGLSAFHHDVIRDMVASGTTMDLAMVFEEMSSDGRLAAYEATDRFYEIGSPQGLRDLEEHLSER